MEPTLLVGDRFRVDRNTYNETSNRTPQPGEVVVFVWPPDRRKKMVKRVVAIGGQTLEIRGSWLYVDGSLAADTHAHAEPAEAPVPCEAFGPYTVPAGHVFVLGDNRSASYDSRHYGPIPLADVEGRVTEVYASRGADGFRWDRFGLEVE